MINMIYLLLFRLFDSRKIRKIQIGDVYIEYLKIIGTYDTLIIFCMTQVSYDLHNKIIISSKYRRLFSFLRVERWWGLGN